MTPKFKMKNILVIFMVFTFCFLPNLAFADPVAAVSGTLDDQLELKNSYITPVGPVKQQKHVIPVSGVRDANPGIYWFQKDDGDWYATSYRAPGGQKKTANIGSDHEPWPAVEEITDKINMKNDSYRPNSYLDKQNKSYTPNQVTNAHIAKVMTTGYQEQKSKIIELQISDLYFVLITSYTGEIGSGEQDGTNLYRQEYNKQQEVNGRPSTRPNGAPKRRLCT